VAKSLRESHPAWWCVDARSTDISDGSVRRLSASSEGRWERGGRSLRRYRARDRFALEWDHASSIEMVRTVVLLTAVFWLGPCLAWGHEGHQVIALIAEHYIADFARAKASALLEGNGTDVIASWADDYRHHHREPGSWLYFGCPLAEPKIDMARNCPQGNCVIAKTEQFLGTLRDPAHSLQPGQKR